MKIKRVKMKGLLYLVITVFSLSLSGCKKAETESDRGPDAERSVETEDNHVVDFPADFNETIGNVTFHMDIHVNTDLTEAPVVTAKAQMQKVNQEKAFQLFFSGIDTYDTYDYEEKDEYGKNAHSITYVSPEETTLAYGPKSSKFEYMERDLMPYVLTAFVPFQDERYNADLYSTEAQLSFMNREEAFETIGNALKEMDINMEADYTGYALDHKTMQSQEHHEDIDGNVDKTQYKSGWSEKDDCYYFCVNQTYKGLPVYSVYNEMFTDAEDANAPIQAVVSREGIEWLKIEIAFTFLDEKGGVSLADMDAVVKAAADKYNQVLGEAEYEITRAELYYYVDLSSGMGTYEVKPVWILAGNEKGGRNIQVIIDAQTAEELVP